MGGGKANGPERTESGSPSPSLVRLAAVFAACGVDIAVLIVGGVWLGGQVDQHMHSSPWGLLVGMLIGLVTGLLSVALLVRRFIALV